MRSSSGAEDTRGEKNLARTFLSSYDQPVAMMVAMMALDLLHPWQERSPGSYLVQPPWWGGFFPVLVGTAWHVKHCFYVDFVYRSIGFTL